MTRYGIPAIERSFVLFQVYRLTISRQIVVIWTVLFFIDLKYRTVPFIPM
jgi:hypothetical protein